MAAPTSDFVRFVHRANDGVNSTSVSEAPAISDGRSCYHLTIGMLAENGRSETHAWRFASGSRYKR